MGAPAHEKPSLPDTSSPSFAVLELLGFSSSSDSLQSCAAPSLSSLQQCTLISHSQAQQPPASVSLNLPSCPLLTSLDPPLSPHTDSSVKVHADSSIESLSMSGARDAAPVPPSMPSEAKRTTAMDGVKVVQIGTKENVVHTTSLNFKDVVQKLTGASPNDQDIMPVTLPNRPIATPPIRAKASPNKVLDALSVKVDASKGFKKTPSKLHERRKAFRNLERLSTNKPRAALSESSLPPLALSPVTPLASYFEMFATATTPTPSRSSRSSSPGYSFLESDSLKGPMIAPSPIDIAEHFMPAGGVHAEIQQRASLVESLPSPSLLSLFPESPLCNSENFRSHPP